MVVESSKSEPGNPESICPMSIKYFWHEVILSPVKMLTFHTSTWKVTNTKN